MERSDQAEEDRQATDLRWWRGLLTWQWAVLIALLVYAPLGLTGYVLTYDMAWVPRPDLRRLDTWGLGDELPSGVPSDAVVALLGALLPAALVQRLVLVGAMVLAAAGATRLTPGWSLPATLTTATFYAWNPFVAERLLLGEWPLLLAYAALPWLIWALRSPSGPHWGPATIALAVTAMSPVGGLIGLVVGLASAWGRGVFRLFFTAGLVNVPWIVASALHAVEFDADPASFRAFNAQAEGHLGRWGAVLSLGGVWNRDAVPDSRTLWTTLVLVLVMGAVMVVGLVSMARENRGFLIALAVPAVLALAIVIVGFAASPEGLGRRVDGIPGVGLLTDGTRYLAMAAPLEAVALGAGAAEVARRIRPPDVGRGVAVLLVVVPFLALPDLAWGVGGRLAAVTYPPTWEQARLTIAASDVKGDVLVLPFSAYRQPDWNDDRPVLDPAGRYFDRTTVTQDVRVVMHRGSELSIRGEDPRARRIGRILRDGAEKGADPKRLARQGIGIVVVDTDAPGARDALRAVKRLDEFGRTAPDRRGAELRLFAVDDARERELDDQDRVVMLAAWSMAGLALLIASVAAVRGAIRRSHQPPSHPSRQ